jgi:hypothetical protein
MSIFKEIMNIDMSFPPEKPFIPKVSKVHVLDASSGNPRSFQDPNSVATLGKSIQAMTDQVSADTLYDKKEAFRNEVYSPWILKTEACTKKEGYETHNKLNSGIMALVILGALGVMCSFYRKK